jgi:hypothetical protein
VVMLKNACMVPSIAGFQANAQDRLRDVLRITCSPKA